MEGTPLKSDQRALLDLLLSRDFPGRAELARQAETVRTGGSSCSCGCPSFYLVADRSLPPAAVSEPVVSHAHGTDRGGNHVGVLLFVTEDGYLAEVEIYGIEGRFAGIPQREMLKLSEAIRSSPTFRYASDTPPLS